MPFFIIMTRQMGARKRIPLTRRRKERVTPDKAVDFVPFIRKRGKERMKPDPTRENQRKRKFR